MEITRNIKTGYSAAAEATAPARADAAATKASSTANVIPAPEPRLEQLQEAMRSLPEIDLEQVAAIKQAMARGELGSDVKVLAQSILAYHRGSDL